MTKKMDDPKMVKLFMKEVCKSTPPCRADERKICEAMASGDKAARKKMILGNMRMVVVICSRYVGQGVPALDLYIEGFLGLHEATKRFNVSMNFKFTSYAVWWIRQRITIALAQGLPGYSRPPRFFMERRALDSGEEMSDSAAAKIERMARAVVSTESGIYGSVMKSSEPGPEVAVEDADTRAAVFTAVKKLSEREGQVISMFFGLSGAPAHNLREISERVGVSRERVRQIKKEALKKLKRFGGLRELCPAN